MDVIVFGDSVYIEELHETHTSEQIQNAGNEVREGRPKDMLTGIIYSFSLSVDWHPPFHGFQQS